MENLVSPHSDSIINNKIKKLVSENHTSDALKLLLELSQPNKQVHDAIHIVLGEFNDLTSQRLRGTIENSEATRRLNIVHDKILFALDSFDSQGKPLPSSVAFGPGRTTKFLLRLGLFIVFISLLMVGIAFIIKEESKNAADILFLSAILIGQGGLIVLGGWLIALLVNALKGR